MLSKNQTKLITSLQQKKFRKEHGLFIAEGEKVVNELINARWKIHSVYLTKNFFEETFLKWKNISGLKYELITEKELSTISSLTTPQEIIAVAEIPEASLEVNPFDYQLTLFLDEIKDPGNLGTIIRIADWFGIWNVICSENSADAFNPKVVQASMGSLFRVTISYMDLGLLLKENIEGPKIPVYGTVLSGENIYHADLKTSGFILVGNESRGISEELKQYITHKISIPSFSKGNVDSLNAAMATAIVCSEFRRRMVTPK